MQLDIRSLPIPEVKLVKAKRISDTRGYFSETYTRAAFAECSIDHDFVQDNQSCSGAVGTVRGLHYQCPPFAQTKLVRVLRGKILDVAVDLRRSSPNYGKHVAVELSEENDEQLIVPAGFAHGFCTMEPNTIVFYKVDAHYSPDHDRGINWADPALGIAWPVSTASAILSDKDHRLPMLSESPHVFN